MSERFIAGRYRIVERLGASDYGDTYLAEDTQLLDNKLCIVKKLRFRYTDEFTIETAKRLFPKKAKILNKLGENFHIPRLLAYLEENEEFYLVQEYIKGINLEREITEIELGVGLEESEVVKILDEILAILTFVHQNKVVHRDIKPSNIMRREEDGKLFLIDFDIFKEIDTEVSKDRAYSPIEQIKGQPTYASDLYALGMVTIFALTKMTPNGLRINYETGETRWRDCANVNYQLADIIDRMVRQDYRDRYPSAIEAHQALKEYLNPPPVDY